MRARLEQDSFAAYGGLALVHRRFVPEAAPAVRVLALVHGLAEHGERYAPIAEDFARRGYDVHTYDQRGHGDSEGPRIHSPSFAHLLDDLDRFLARVREKSPGLPVVLLGHSMGGLEVASYLVKRRPAIALAVLTGPALGLEDPSSALLALARGLGRVAPRLRLPSRIDASVLSHDPAVVAGYESDPRIDPRPTAGLMRALLLEISEVEGRGADVHVPIWIGHGEEDALVPAEASRRFFANVDQPGSEIHTYPGLYHEILNEPERPQLLQQISDWIDKRLGPPAL